MGQTELARLSARGVNIMPLSLSKQLALFQATYTPA